MFFGDGDERNSSTVITAPFTSPRAELTAVIKGLRLSSPGGVIYTDSDYALRAISEGGWSRASHANSDLVSALLREIKNHPSKSVLYVQAHAGIEGNEKADKLARRVLKEYVGHNI